MATRSGQYRHRIDVERNTATIDSQTGYRTPVWAAVVSSEPAGFLPGPGREFLAGEAVRSSSEGRFVLRYHAATAAILSTDRVRWNGEVWTIQAPPLFDITARKEIILMVAKGVVPDAP